MGRYIQTEGVVFRIRGNYTAQQLRELFAKTLMKYPGTKLTLRTWLVRYGKVHNRVQGAK